MAARPSWKDSLLRLKNEVQKDHVSVVSAGVAFFGLLAIFPAVTALISIAGLFLNPADVATQLLSMTSLLPRDAASIITDQVQKVTGASAAGSTLAALFGFAVALYGAMKGAMTLMEGMNIAYDEVETRGFAALYGTALALTVSVIVGLVLAFAAVMLGPTLVAWLGLPKFVQDLITGLRWPLLALLTVLGLCVVYRFGPSRPRGPWRRVVPGALLATVLWLLGTVAFSVYAQNFGSYNKTYGTLGGVIILLTWLWLSAFIVLGGAELNAEIERRAGTVRPPGPASVAAAPPAPPQASRVPDPATPLHARGISPRDRSVLGSVAMIVLLSGVRAAALRMRRRSGPPADG